MYPWKSLNSVKYDPGIIIETIEGFIQYCIVIILSKRFVHGNLRMIFLTPDQLFLPMLDNSILHTGTSPRER